MLGKRHYRRRGFPGRPGGCHFSGNHFSPDRFTKITFHQDNFYAAGAGEEEAESAGRTVRARRGRRSARSSGRSELTSLIAVESFTLRCAPARAREINQSLLNSCPGLEDFGNSRYFIAWASCSV